MMLFRDIDIKKDYFAAEKKILKVFGVSFSGGESFLYKTYAFLVLSIPYTYTFLAIIELFKGHSFEDICVMLIYDSGITLDVIKMSILLMNRPKISTILNNIQKGIFAANPERGGVVEENLIRQCLSFNRLQMMGYFLPVPFTIGSAVLITIFKRIKSSNYHDWDLQFGKFTALNITYSPNYELVAAYQNFTFIFCGFTFITNDLLFVGILSHISVQFKIVQNNLRNILEDTYKRMVKDTSHAYNGFSKLSNFDPSTIPQRYFKQSIKDIVVHHLAVIDLAKEVEEIFSLLLLLVYGLNMILLCFTLYVCSSVAFTDTKMMIFVPGNMSINFQFFVICYWCDEMTTQSLAVADAASEANFVGAPSSFQKDLAFIIQRSLKPTVMTAGKFFSITLTTFMRIQQTSYSFFMVVRKKKS